MSLGEGGEREADEDKGGGEDLTETGPLGYELCCGRVVLQVGDERAPEELHPERGWPKRCYVSAGSWETMNDNEAAGKTIRLTVTRTVEVNPKSKARHDPIPRSHVRRGHHERVNPHTPLEQRQQRPLAIIIIVPSPGPRRDDAVNQVAQSLAEVRDPVGRLHIDPPTVLMLSNRIKSHLSHEPRHRRRRGRGEHEARDPPQRRLADGREGRLLVALAAQLDGLQRAHVARHEGEDGHADAALDQDPQVRQLHEARGRVFLGCRAEELAVPGAGEVGQHYEGGCDATEAL